MPAPLNRLRSDDRDAVFPYRAPEATVSPGAAAPGVPAADRHARALAFWYGLIDYERRTIQPGDLKLDRMRTLLQFLGNPQDRLRIIHIAGSKGKGSTSAMLAAVLRRAGYRTGMFTSPHLCSVEERIQVDGEPITAAELTELLEEIAAVAPRVARAVADQVPAASRDRNTSLTFFEVATAIGFLHFARRRVDAAVVEVGLGGRFDSTNVCRPVMSVITSISFDHTQQLGNRLASIAREKAGIVKPGRPVVSGATAPEARAVIERVCGERRAALRQLGVDFRYQYEPGHVTAEDRCSPRVQVTTRRSWPVLEVGLLGEHQAANAAVVVACVEELRAAGLHIGDQAVADGLASVSWPARLEVLGQRPLLVLDCAHNVASAQALVDTLQSSFPPARRLLLFAASTDKDLAGMLRVLAPHFSHVFLTRYHSNPRSAAPEDLADLVRRAADVNVSLHATPEDAWRVARGMTGPDDLLCITGSVFLAGELRPLMLGEEREPV
jgi:dihydrofolate synthase/folylpolyglutamate synthase